MSRYVDCPDGFANLLEKVEDMITPLFWDFKRNPKSGCIDISSERYVMYRSESMAIAVQQQLSSVLGAGAGVAIYQIGKAIGTADAVYYFAKTNIQDTKQKIAIEPVVFAFSGFANVRILPESRLIPNDDFLLVYEHPNSFAAEAHIKANITVETPVDFLNAGYSAGWCSEASGLKLETKEISCKAMGHKQCRFVTAPCHRLRERIREIKTEYPL